MPEADPCKELIEKINAAVPIFYAQIAALRADMLRRMTTKEPTK